MIQGFGTFALRKNSVSSAEQISLNKRVYRTCEEGQPSPQCGLWGDSCWALPFEVKQKADRVLQGKNMVTSRSLDHRPRTECYRKRKCWLLDLYNRPCVTLEKCIQFFWSWILSSAKWSVMSSGANFRWIVGLVDTAESDSVCLADWEFSQVWVSVCCSW